MYPYEYMGHFMQRLLFNVGKRKLDYWNPELSCVKVVVKPPIFTLNHHKITSIVLPTPHQLLPSTVYSSCVASMLIYKVNVWWMKIILLYSTFLMGCTSVCLFGIFIYSLSKYAYCVYQILQGRGCLYRCMCLLIILHW